MKGFVAWWIRLCCGARIQWRGAEPRSGPRVYFANHGSHLDAALIWASLPPVLRARTRPVAARDYWQKGHLRPWLAAQVFRALLIERKQVTRSDNPIAQMSAVLQEGEALILFPEGTRSPDLMPRPFKSGLYHLARRNPEVELVPVYLENLNRILPKGEFLPVPMLGNISIGTPLRLAPGEDRDSFLTRAHQAVCSLNDACP